MAKLLIDECLHTSLLKLAHEAGHTADHVNYLGLGSSKDWDLMNLILDQDYIFVTNNRTDFIALYGRTKLHAGLVVIVPNVTPALQRELFRQRSISLGSRNSLILWSRSNSATRQSSVSDIPCHAIEYPSAAAALLVFLAAAARAGLVTAELGFGAAEDPGWIGRVGIRDCG